MSNLSLIRKLTQSVKSYADGLFSHSISDVATTEKNGLMSKEDKKKVNSYVITWLSESAGAAFHNSLYRGKNLGNSVTDKQYEDIANGVFGDIFIGDYWIINERKYIIADFNYWLYTGINWMNTNHVLLVPSCIMYKSKMHSISDTSVGYTGTDLYKSGLEQAKQIIYDAFGEEHILTHKEFFVNSAVNSKPSAASYYDSKVELMTERMVYGNGVFSSTNDGSANSWHHSVDNSQLSLFRLCHSRIVASYEDGERCDYWLRDIDNNTSFCKVGYDGRAHHEAATISIGVRPIFAICAA